jgi:hypothetical protein
MVASMVSVVGLFIFTVLTIIEQKPSSVVLLMVLNALGFLFGYVPIKVERMLELLLTCWNILCVVRVGVAS